MKSIGISAFGLNDVLCVDNDSLRGRHDQPACVLLPDLPRAPIKAGLEATESRVFSGMQWPEDAMVARDDIRRVPVAAAWRRLSESHGISPRWRRKSVSFPVSDILTAHVRTFLAENNCQPESGDRCCLVIPNQLDMFAQEALLRSLRSIGMDTERTSLLWRPVAAALSWLSALTPQSVEMLLDKLHEKLLLIYAGVDSIEITLLGLQAQEKQGRTYILPVRSTPEPALKLCGLDWALEMAGACEDICQLDDGALWQATFRFPQIWQLLAGRPIDTLPMPWSTHEGWRLWQPMPSFEPLQMKACRHAWTSLLAYPTEDNEVGKEDDRVCPTWQGYLRDKLQGCLDSAGCGVLFGPLSSLFASHPALSDRVVDVPHMRGIWHAEEDCMAKGAAIYASRLASGLPTYLDTLPRLEVYCTTKGKGTWINLVPTSTVEGGESYEDSFRDKFFLRSGNPELEMYLRLGGETEKQEENIRTAVFKFPETPTQNEPLRLDVRMRPVSGLAQVDLVPENSSFLGGRKIPFDFERMAPGSPPEDTSGNGLKYPENLTRKVLVPASEWMQVPAVQKLLTFTPSDCQRKDVAKKILDGLEYLRDMPKKVNGKNTYPPRIDEEGKTGSPEGDEMVRAIAKQVEMFWYCFCKYHPNRLRKFITRATYLWRATPQCVIDGIYDILADHCFNRTQYKYFKLDYEELGYVYEAAGRCFSQEEHCKIMFLTFEQRNSNINSIYIGFIRPLFRLLSYNPIVKDYLDDRFAYILIDISLETANQELNKNSIKYLSRKFFVGIQLFMVALMQRKNNSNFMNKNTSDMARRYYDEMSELLERAKLLDRWDNVSRILDGIKKYMDYEGESGLLGCIDEYSR